MPPKKKVIPKTKHDCCFDRGCGVGDTPTMERHSHDFIRKIFITLSIILFAYIIVWVGTLIRNNVSEYNYIGLSDRLERTITVDASATVDVVPDVAHVTLGMTVFRDTVEEAQTENSDTINELIGKLKALGIADEDIKTQNYNVYPRYDYSEDVAEEIGFEVSQNVAVTMRDTKVSNSVIALAGELGLNQVGGLNFEVDDKLVFQQKARDEAIEKAYVEARNLAKVLGVNLISIVSYSEYESGGDFPYMARAYAMEDVGFGGAPEIEVGSEEVSVTVNITFEIR